MRGRFLGAINGRLGGLIGGLAARNSALRSLRAEILATGDRRLRTGAAAVVDRFAVPAWAQSSPQRYVANALALDGIGCRPALADPEAGEVELRVLPAAPLAAAAVTLVAAVPAFYAYWIYGLVTIAAGAAAAWLAVARPGWVERALAPWTLRGRLLGAVLALALLVLAFVVVAVPIHLAREHGVATIAHQPGPRR